MSAQHTPGPWWICVDDTGDRPVPVPSIQAPEEYDCAIVHWDGFWQTYWQSARGNKEMWANARLIAAAPEMLDLLDQYVSDLRYPPTGDSIQRRIDRAERIISRARGEA